MTALRPADLRELLTIAEAIVGDAEHTFTRGLGARPSKLKSPGDFATQVDVAIERELRAKLTDLTGLPVVGEETGGDQSAPNYWAVDPIDGTSNFAAGNPMCAILVALINDGEPVAGITSLPLLGWRMTAYQGSQLKFNGEIMTPLTEPENLAAHVGFTSVASPYESEVSSAERLGLIEGLSHTYLRPRITGSVGVDLAFAAKGIFSGALSLSPHLWDNAAGVVLVRAAGGVVTDLAGQPWHPGSDGVIAGAASAHAAILSTMKKVRSR